MRTSSTGIMAGLLLMVPAAATAADAPPYHQVATIKLGAPERWDYVVADGDRRRVYVAHGDRVTVIDADRDTVIGQVTGISGGTHGVAIDPGHAVGFTDDGERGEAVAFDLGTLKTGAHLPTADDSDAATFDPSSGHAYIVNGEPGTITVIDPVRMAVLTTIQVGGKLEYAVPDGRGNLYVNGEERHELIRIDTASNRVVARWPMDDCQQPHGLALDADTRRLFSGCANGVLEVLDADGGQHVASLAIGRGSDAVNVDAQRRLVLSSNGGDGTLSVIRIRDRDHFEPLATVTTQRGARTFGLDRRTGKLYIASAQMQAASEPGVRPQAVPGSLSLLVLAPSP